MTIIYSVAIGISMAATALVARRTGEHDPDARRAGRGAGHPLEACSSPRRWESSWAVSRRESFSSWEERRSWRSTAETFARIMLGGNATVFLIFLINAVFRGAGDAVIAMRDALAGECHQYRSRTVFYFGWGPFPELGSLGPPWRRISDAASVLYQVWHLLGHHSRIRMRLCISCRTVT
jgi:Na+-driven multidrug efflux pump